MLAQTNMNKRQLKKNEKAQIQILEINKDYRKTSELPNRKRQLGFLPRYD